MLKRLFVLLACAASLVLAQETERVVGSSLVTEDGDLQALFVELLPQTFDQAEVDLFAASLEPIEKWAKTNGEAWNSIEESETPLPSIYALGVWAEIDLSAPEFVALLIKLSGAKEVASGSMNAEEMKQMVAFFESMANDETMPAEDRKDAQAQVDSAKKMVAAVESYPAGNLEVYKANQEKIDGALERFEQIGEDEPQAPKEDGGN